MAVLFADEPSAAEGGAGRARISANTEGKIAVGHYSGVEDETISSDGEILGYQL